MVVASARAGRDDHAWITELLGRSPNGDYEIIVRADDETPIVIRNAPFLADGRPMPTRYWLCGPELRVLIGRLESASGVRRSEADTPMAEIMAAHARYAAERDAAIAPDHEGPRPSGGVGGTRRGVKCLHAHYAWFLAGGDDPVGQWVHDHLEEVQ